MTLATTAPSTSPTRNNPSATATLRAMSLRGSFHGRIRSHARHSATTASVSDGSNPRMCTAQCGTRGPAVHGAPASPARGSARGAGVRPATQPRRAPETCAVTNGRQTFNAVAHAAGVLTAHRTRRGAAAPSRAAMSPEPRVCVWTSTRGVTGFAHAGEITAATRAHRNDARAATPVHAPRAAATRLAFAFEKPSIWIGGSWGPKPAWEKDASACTSPPTTKAMPFEGGGRPNRFLESRSIRPSPCFVSVSSTAHVPGRRSFFVARAAFTSRHVSTAAPSANRLWRSVRPLFKTTDAPMMSPADGSGPSSEPSATMGRTLNERCRYRSGAKRSRSLGS